MSEASEAVGQRLKAERERKGLSTQRVADELHLDGWVVDALESGEYERIGPAVYAKGHLKRYAGILGLPADELLEGFSSHNGPVVPPQPAAMRMRASAPAGSELPWLQIVGFAAVAVAVIGVLIWHPWRPRTTAVTAPTALADVAPAGAAPPAGPDTGPEAGGDDQAPGTGNAPLASAGGPPVGGADAATGATRPPAPGAAGPGSRAVMTGPATGTPLGGAAMVAGAKPAAAVSGAANPAAASGRAKLRFSFSADSWVDIHDAAGLRIYAGTGHANSVRTISGAAPLRVYLKSASGVQLEVNNRAVAIGRQYVAGSAAHFEAGADGVLRRDPQTPAAGTAPAHVVPPARNPRPRG